MTASEYRHSRDLYQQAKGAHEARVAKLYRVQDTLVELQTGVRVIEVAMKMLESLALQAQAIIHERIDNIVSAALQTVYQDGNIRFLTEIERTADRMEAHFNFVYGEDAMPGPVMETVGGGMIDVASLTLRVVISRILGIRGPIVLDEPFRHVDQDALPRLVSFARTLCHDLDMQLIVISHDPVTKVAADNTIVVSGRGQIAQGTA